MNRIPQSDCKSLQQVLTRQLRLSGLFSDDDHKSRCSECRALSKVIPAITQLMNAQKRRTQVSQQEVLEAFLRGLEPALNEALHTSIPTFAIQ